MRPHLAAAMDLFIARLAGVKIAAIGRTGTVDVGQAGVAEVTIALQFQAQKHFNPKIMI